MAILKYSDIRITGAFSNDDRAFICPASSASINVSNSLEMATVLAPNQNAGMRISGPVKAKISLSFMAANKFFNDVSGSGGYSYNLLSGLLANGTGDNYFDMKIGGSLFQKCYLDSLSLSIAPFAPISVAADFTCARPPTGERFSGATGSSLGDEDMEQAIAYGHLTTISGGAKISDPIYSSISYKINCQRSYQYALGQVFASNIFLDSISRELSIQSTNIFSFINQSGNSESIYIAPQNILGQLIVPSDWIGVSDNSYITSQVISAQEADFVIGDISIEEHLL